MPARAVLPNRRPNETRVVAWQGNQIAVTVGFYDSGLPGEVFADAAAGGHLQATLADACVLVSIALQHGLTPEALSKSLGRVPDWVNGERVETPASPVGAVVAALVQAAGQPCGR